ncbi:rhodanese-like domain-containing protein [Edwardsiella piscicida]|nr:rhodanese-like domain-containing protein [Edwardsiella piscicida]UCQ20097.1 rhodanese-like domain-containing protein [Edwardsiella piscicida]UJT81530.1 rhodanese-like domain-containing protein [Edwardsiella piscicida]WCF13559.1 rhodanese-like domain-containing protein [Edwardsiella piscicida]WLJ42568.1 rhodanese-like domain-containing protein [Edwardsiella piscicida]GAJ63739.1 rhodanese domain-containing protein [Edwardsiella piscicida]
MMKPVLPLVAGVMLAALSALPAQAGLFSSSEVDAEKQAVQLARETANGTYQLLTVQELKQWMDEKKPMLIVDTMPFSDSYKKQHIPGALNMAFPMGDMNVWDKANMGAITQADFMRMLGADKDRVLVFYCGFVKCARSHNAAMWAKKLGYQHVYRLPGGITAWKEAGYPVEKASTAAPATAEAAKGSTCTQGC